MCTKIAAWIRSPAASFRLQAWRLIQKNMEFLEAHGPAEFKAFSYERKFDFTTKFLMVQRNRIMIFRFFIVAMFTLIAYAFLKRS